MYKVNTSPPLKMVATFNCNDQTLKKMWSTGLQNIKNSARRLNYEVPYFEQSYYTGDTQIQALISLYLSGEETLIKKLILDFYLSRSGEKTNTSVYSRKNLRVIPAFSLFWVCMVYDYWMHGKDKDFITQFLSTISDILDWYERQMEGKEEITNMIDWCNVTDWSNFNGWGITPGKETGKSSASSLQYAYTLQQAAKLFNANGQPENGKKYAALANHINKNTLDSCFNDDKGLFADTPEKKSYSQNANIWAILSGAVEDKRAKEIMVRLIYDKSIEQATFFYRFHLTQALKKVGFPDQYYGLVKPSKWESPSSSAVTKEIQFAYPKYYNWSDSPNYDFLATICGIMSSESGFRKVLIQPSLGNLVYVEATMPHPEGVISVKYQKTGKSGLVAEIDLPETVSGKFIWKDRSIAITGGKQILNIKETGEN